MSTLLFCIMFVGLVLGQETEEMKVDVSIDQVHGRSVPFCSFKGLRFLPGSIFKDYTECFKCKCTRSGFSCNLMDTATDLITTVSTTPCRNVIVGCKAIWIQRSDESKRCGRKAIQESIDMSKNVPVPSSRGVPFSFIRNAFLSLTQPKVAKALTNIFTNPIGAVNNMVPGIIKASKDLADIAKDGADKAEKVAENALELANDAINIAGKAAKDAQDSIQETSKFINKKTFSVMKDVLGGVKGLFKDTAEDAVEIATEIANEVVGMANDVADVATNTAKDALGFAEKTVNTVKNVAEDVLNGPIDIIKDEAVKMAEQVADGAEATAKHAVEIATEAADTAKTVAANVGNVVGNTGNKIFNALFGKR